MSKRSRAFVFLLLVQSALIALGVAAFAQADPAKVLVGTWEGWVEATANPERALVIRSVKAKDGGGWTADGRYGYNTEKMGRTPIDISQQGSDLVLEFLSGEKNPVKLKLVGDNKLEGTANFVVTGRTTNRGIRFEKKDKPTKAE